MMTNIENNFIQKSQMRRFLEIKSFSDSQQEQGIFKGYGAFFNNSDSYNDIILPGAFKKSIEQIKKTGFKFPMRLMHGFASVAELPIGVWQSIEEDAQGLLLTGKISAMDTDQGKMIYELMKDGALSGLSIGFYLENGDSEIKNNTRYIKNLNLIEVSLVDVPANNQARITEIKKEPKLSETTLKSFSIFLNEIKSLSSLSLKMKNMDAPKDNDNDKENAFNMAMMQAMNKMNKAMNAIDMNKPPDEVFAAMMLPHHIGASEMAEIELKYGSSDEMKALATRIIATQKPEIQKLQNFLK